MALPSRETRRDPPRRGPRGASDRERNLNLVEDRGGVKTVVARRTFTNHDQTRFAELTGDRNPMHLDAMAARRTQAGDTVVHGMHAVLWAIDRLFADGTIRGNVTTVEVDFQRFMYLAKEVAVSNVRSTERGVKFQLVCENVVSATIGVVREPTLIQAGPRFAGEVADISYPADFTISDMSGRSGQLPQADAAIAAEFRSAASAIGAPTIKALAQLSTLVGMVCPGLHSIFGSARVHITQSSRDMPLTYAVRRVDHRFQLVDIDVSGSGISGSVSAFVRQPPVECRPLKDIRARILEGEFASTTALIVGGSRGLGEATAKAIIAAGGRAIITYARGKRDAEAIAFQLGEDVCQTVRFDVREDAAHQLSALPWAPNALYYFASPQIFRQKGSWFVAERFREFCDFYVQGFADVCLALHEVYPALRMIFYPSSTVLDERVRDTAEYAAAKAAGERLCEELRERFPELTIHCSRLPRVFTDQTATIISVEAADAFDVMLPIIRELHRAQSDRSRDPAHAPAH